MTPGWVTKEMTAGWRYEHRARDYARRVTDCWGLILWCSQQHLGRMLPDLLDLYDGTMPDGERAVTAIKPQFIEVAAADVQLGDIVLLHSKGIFHAGLATVSDHMLELNPRSPGAVHPSISQKWASRLAGYYRYAG